MSVSIFIIFGCLLLSLYLGIRARRGKDMDLEQWTVGGRGFGTLFLILLMAGEIYSTFTFLGASGWAYGIGGPIFYFLATGSLCYIVSYFLLPPVWKYAKKHNLLSQSDFFVKKYNSPYLGVLVALVGTFALIPYLVLQLKGLGIIVSVASYGSISSTMAIWIGMIAVTAYVMISGIHGSAWTAVVKDILILVVVLFLGFYIPFHYYGGIQSMFEVIDAAKPGHLMLPDKGFSVSWYISTLILYSLGFYMWPQYFGAAYSAKDGNAFRKNAIILPLYQLMIILVLFVGFAAILQVPDLKGPDVDQALLLMSIKTFDPWFVGVIGAAGLLAAIVPGSMILMTASTLLAKNVYQVFSPSASNHKVVSIAKVLVPVIALIAVYFALNGGNTIVALILMGLSLVTQLFPSLAASLLQTNSVTKQGAFAGILAGTATVVYTTVTKTTIGSLFPTLPQEIKDMNVGIIALIVNIVVMAVVSFATRSSRVVSKQSHSEGDVLKHN